MPGHKSIKRRSTSEGRKPPSLLAYSAIAAFGLAIGLMVAAPGSMAQNPPKTIEAGKLHVAFNGDMPMTGWENDKLVGTDGALLTLIAERLGLQIVPNQMEWSAEIESVKVGKVDIMLGAMGWTKERSQVMSLTDPIYYFGISLVQKKATSYDSVEDMAGRSVGTVNGFAQAQELKTVPGTKEVMLYDTTDAALRDVLAGRVDMVILDPPLVGYAIKQHPEWEIHQVPMTADTQKYPMMAGYFSIIMGMNKDNPELFAAVNEQIGKIWADCTNVETLGSFGLVEAHWFQPPAENYRAGVDRPADWVPPSAPEKCTAMLQQ